MVNSLPYAFVALLLIICSVLWRREKDASRKKFYTIAAVAVSVFFFCFRGFISNDWQIYCPFFQTASFDDIYSYFHGGIGILEPGYTALNMLVRRIYPNYHFFTFVVGILDLALMLNFARRRVDNLPLFLLLFFVFDGVLIFCNLIRNFISILIFLNALPFLERRKPLPYFLLCLLALSFHISAIFYFPIYFFFRRYPNKWIFLAVFLVCNIVFLSRISIVASIASHLDLTPVLQKKLTSYTEYFDYSRVLSIGFLERLITGILVFCFYDKMKEKHGGNGIYINAILAFYMFYYLLGEFQEMSSRLANLFVYGYWVVWIDLIDCFAVRNNRRLFIAFVFIYCLLRMLLGYRNPVFRYENVLFGSSTYQERIYYNHKVFEGN
ncbi:MAG: EpsG family protein [Prevotella sp.]|nr:EpsG family protein [Prevotella sp.]